MKNLTVNTDKLKLSDVDVPVPEKTVNMFSGPSDIIAFVI